MKSSVIFIIAVLSICCSLNAQDTSIKGSGIMSIRKNSIYFEILGSIAVYSINYDRILPLGDKLAMFLRVGGNEYHGDNTDELSWNLLGGTGILYGGPKHFLDTGLGYTYFMGSPDRLTTISVGYRFQGFKGLVVRVTPMYIYNTEKGDTFGNSLWFGLSFGYSF